MILELTQPEFLYLRRLLAACPVPLDPATAPSHWAIQVKLENHIAGSLRRQREKIEDLGESAGHLREED